MKPRDERTNTVPIPMDLKTRVSSGGAKRAAKKLLFLDHEPGAKEMAEIIDQEVHLPELIDALREAELDFRCYENNPLHPAKNFTLKTIRNALRLVETK